MRDERRRRSCSHLLGRGCGRGRAKSVVGRPVAVLMFPFLLRLGCVLAARRVLRCRPGCPRCLCDLNISMPSKWHKYSPRLSSSDAEKAPSAVMTDVSSYIGATPSLASPRMHG
ncbi:MAG: hypothetical protein J3K34DRAFT_404144 [Monoraphidium minutum]|nr:MAG: hypothetical protein J3K34DRAFT_404144 [Monoraphidium minutum]